MPEASPPQSEDTVFSVATLLKYMGDDDKALAIVSKIVRDACAPGMEPFEQARVALQQQRHADAGKIFHSLRGSIGALGAKRLVTSSLALEHALAQQRHAEIPALLDGVESEYTQVLQHAGAWLRQNAPGGGPSAQV